MTPPPPVGRTAFLLGVAGLLPQAGAVGRLAMVRSDAPIGAGFGAIAALIYGGVILSFLGGMWWGFAMRREEGQGRLAVLATLPSLVAAALPASFLVTEQPFTSSLVALGVAILLTLVVDRHLVATGDAPANWMRLRVPLSVGLGGLTIAAGLLA